VSTASGSVSRFTIGDSDFLLDARPYRVISGAIHYFRVHPAHWRDRIAKARQMGLNTIETYVAWNEHSPDRDTFDTSDRLDLARFLTIVHEEGMHAIVRPGPYICAEWDNGGLPAWLFRDGDVGIRTLEPRYMDAAGAYLRRVYDIVAPLQIDRGGPVILVQIENEYGAYGADSAYLRELVQIARDSGITVPLTSIDQPTDEMLAAGSIPGLLKTGSFGSRVDERLATLRAHQPEGPLMCAEFWDGWFDHWGAHHHTTSASDSAAELDALLTAGASVNIYMFHGGTNFGFTNGANDKGVYQPTVTSYDYDAPLDEAGHPTAKYFAFRDVIARHSPAGSLARAPEAAPAAPSFEVALTDAIDIMDALDRLGSWTESERIPTLDDLEQYRGLAVHRTVLSARGGRDPAVLDLGEVRDRAWVFLDDVLVGVASRSDHESRVRLPRHSGELTVLVEDQGRVNYGDRLGERKGLLGAVSLDGEPVTGWLSLPIDADRIDALFDSQQTRRRSPDPAHPVAGPIALSATVDIDDPVDLFLDTAAFGKGFAFVNGFALGRYWRRGPQQTLYVPGPVLHSGPNRFVIVELESVSRPSLRFLPAAHLGHTDW
jgi:beta-galactosidase